MRSCTGSMAVPLRAKQRNIYLSSTPKGRRRLSERAAIFMLYILFIFCSCGSTPWLKIVPPLPICLAPNPFLSDFRRPSSFGAGRSTHTGVKVRHSTLSTFFWSPPNSASTPNSTSSITVLLQECRNTCTCLWIQSIKSAPNRGSLAKAFSYCCSKLSM